MATTAGLALSKHGVFHGNMAYAGPVSAWNMFSVLLTHSPVSTVLPSIVISGK